MPTTEPTPIPERAAPLGANSTHHSHSSHSSLRSLSSLDSHRNLHRLALALLLLLTIFTRIYNIQNESVWYDEAVSVVPLSEPTLGEFLKANSFIDKMKTPLYFILEYAWWHSTGQSINALRGLSVLIALATATALFWMLRTWWGLMPAVIATTAFALSRLMIFFGQEIRMYGLMYLFALLSWYALHRACAGRKQFWIAHTVWNLLLLHTHLFGVLSFGAQFVFLFVDAPRNWRRMLAWLAVHAAIAASIVPWLRQFSESDKGTNWIELPTVQTLVETLGYAFPGLLLGSPERFSTVYRIENAITALILIAMIVFVCRRSWADRDERRKVLLLLCWLVLPIAAVFVVSLLVRPCYVNRYILFSAPACLAFMARAIHQMPNPARNVATCIMLGAYAISFATIERPVRTDMAAAANLIESNWQEGDVIFTRGLGFPLTLPLYLEDSRDRILNKTSTYRDVLRDATRGQRTWLLIDDSDDESKDWYRIFDDIVGRRIQPTLKKTIPGQHPLTVILLSPR